MERVKAGPVAEPVVGSLVAEPVDGSPAAELVAGSLAAEPVVGSLAAEPVDGSPVAELVVDNLASEQVAGSLASEQVAGSLAAEQVAGSLAAELVLRSPAAEQAKTFVLTTGSARLGTTVGHAQLFDCKSHRMVERRLKDEAVTHLQVGLGIHYQEKVRHLAARSHSADYSHSGYQRRHFAPNDSDIHRLGQTNVHYLLVKQRLIRREMHS